MLHIIDIETTGLDPLVDTINCIGYLRYDEDTKERVTQIAVTEREQHELVTRLWSDGTGVIGHNIKFDVGFIAHKFGILLRISGDTMMLGVAHDMSSPHGLKDMAIRYLGVEPWDMDTKKKLVLSDELIKYLKLDLEHTLDLYLFMRELQGDTKVKNVYNRILLPATEAFTYTEVSGIQVDKEKLAITLEEKTKELTRLEARLVSIKDINWGSPKQVSNYLCGELGLKTDQKNSVAADILRMRHKDHPVVSVLLEYRAVASMLSKFLRPFSILLAGSRQTLHPSYRLATVRTGRTSCANPNLQQIPRDKTIRSLFVARPGYVLIEADYSQIELRVAAALAEETTMLEILNTGGDIHTSTAKAAKRSDNITKEDRTKAKAINFGFLYGMSAQGFVSYAAKSYGVTVSKAEATEFRQRFFATYSKLERWHQHQINVCNMYGGVDTIFGRFRRIQDIFSADNAIRAQAERIAINTPVQSAASDILLIAMGRIYNTLTACRIVGAVHDALLIEVPEDTAEVHIRNIEKIMTTCVKLPVKLEVDIKVGPWGSGVPFKTYLENK